jgi:hypothetical protein
MLLSQQLHKILQFPAPFRIFAIRKKFLHTRSILLHMAIFSCIYIGTEN